MYRSAALPKIAMSSQKINNLIYIFYKIPWDYYLYWEIEKLRNWEVRMLL